MSCPSATFFGFVIPYGCIGENFSVSSEWKLTYAWKAEGGLPNTPSD